MSTAVWTVLAVAGMVGNFAVFLLLVVTGIRMLESGLAKRRQKRAA